VTVYAPRRYRLRRYRKRVQPYRSTLLQVMALQVAPFPGKKFFAIPANIIAASTVFL
jgi:hypothetical protein